MRIANPLYDNAFKYLMSNDKLAKKVLSTILDKEVLELEVSQQEIVVTDEIRHFTLFRLDFKALIRDEFGKEEQVLIEIQKSKLPNNILRFRNYLGLAYTNSKSKQDETIDEAYPIISIYILGYKIQDIPVLSCKVDRKIVDTSTQKEINIQSDFIELLTHTCYILQAGRLPEKRKSKIEKFMTLFNQAWILEERYILDLEEVPDEFKDIAEYLQRPLLESDAIKRLAAEKELEDIFALHESDMAILHSQLEQAKSEVEQAKSEAEQAKSEVEQAKSEAEQAKSEVEQAKSEVEQAKSEVEQAKSEVEQAKSEVEQAKSEVEQVRSEVEQVRLEAEKVKIQLEEERKQNELTFLQAIQALKHTGKNPDEISTLLKIDIEVVRRLY